MIGDRITEPDYTGKQTILDDLIRELRPIFKPPRTFQRTVYLPGARIASSTSGALRRDPGRPHPDASRLRRRLLTWLLTSRCRRTRILEDSRGSELGDGALPSSARGLYRDLGLGPRGLPARGFGSPKRGVRELLRGTWRRLAFLRGAADPQAKGAVVRQQGYIETSFEPARVFANHLDFQGQLDHWFETKANARMHRDLRAIPAERLATERESMRPSPEPMAPGLSLALSDSTTAAGSRGLLGAREQPPAGTLAFLIDAATAAHERLPAMYAGSAVS